MPKTFSDRPLGRLAPADMDHVSKYPYRLAQPTTVAHVEKTLSTSRSWRTRYNQGEEGACVGFGSSHAMSIMNRMFYDARWLYQQAQLIDEWDDTPPAEGTSVRAAMDVLRDVGHRRIFNNVPYAAEVRWGIEENRWARTVDELRTSVAGGVPFVLGVNWYENFDVPVAKRRWFGLFNEYWIGEGHLGRVRGGHAICGYGASDERQAFKLVNSWGLGYPLVWVPYDTVQRLINEWGEATIITDRVAPAA